MIEEEAKDNHNPCPLCTCVPAPASTYIHPENIHPENCHMSKYLLPPPLYSLTKSSRAYYRGPSAARVEMMKRVWSGIFEKPIANTSTPQAQDPGLNLKAVRYTMGMWQSGAQLQLSSPRGSLISSSDVITCQGKLRQKSTVAPSWNVTVFRNVPVE